MRTVKLKVAGKNLLLAELIVVIAFFSLAAAACVTMFADARRDSRDARDLTNAVIMAQNAAEIFKAGASGENPPQGGLLTQITYDGDERFERAVIVIRRESDDEPIYELTAVREVVSHE
jgi:hypothetical protein